VTDLAGSLVTSSRPPGQLQNTPDDRTWNAGVAVRTADGSRRIVAMTSLHCALWDLPSVTSGQVSLAILTVREYTAFTWNCWQYCDTYLVTRPIVELISRFPAFDCLLQLIKDYRLLQARASHLLNDGGT